MILKDAYFFNDERSVIKAIYMDKNENEIINFFEKNYFFSQQSFANARINIKKWEIKYLH